MVPKKIETGLVGLSEAAKDVPAEAAEEDDGVIGAVSCVVCLLSTTTHTAVLLLKVSC